MNSKVTALPNSSVNIPDTRDIWRSHRPLLSFQSLQVSLMPPGCDRWTRARRALQHLQKMPPRSQLSVITGGIEPNVCLQPYLLATRCSTCVCHNFKCTESTIMGEGDNSRQLRKTILGVLQGSSQQAI